MAAQPANPKAEPIDPAAPLEAVGDILRACGEYAFDTHRHKADAARQRAEQWARHLLMGMPHPENAAVASRDFVGARRFVRELRAGEQQFVRSALADFRNMISSVFFNIEKALLADGDGDVQMKASVAHLRKCLQTSSLEEMRREVTSVSNELTTMLSAREQRRNEQLVTMGTELRSLNTRLTETRRNAELDALTGVHNRGALDSYMDRAHELDGLTGTPLSLLMLDADNFKLLNDTYGHMAGDAALRAIGASLTKSFLRKCDFVARFGGEEFAVVLRDTNLQEAMKMADRARRSIGALEIEGYANIAVTVSVGVAELQLDETALQWLKRADDALLEAKRTGKNRCVAAPVTLAKAS
jgi:diguanylate cyclase